VNGRKCLVIVRYLCSIILFCFLSSGCRIRTSSSSLPTTFFLFPSVICCQFNLIQFNSIQSIDWIWFELFVFFLN
jgi:hypothetical protein